MSDPLHDRADGASPQADADRHAKIESLLLAGLDHYFASDYAQAIDVWTRALFLDRSHARARAYIDRARSAMAEQQRESEELLHSGIAAFERNEIDAARQLLNAAVHRGGAHDVALAFLTRIDRLSAAAASAAEPVSTVRATPVPAVAPSRRLVWIIAAVGVVIAIGAAAAALVSAEDVRRLMPVFGTTDAAKDRSTASQPDVVLVPRSSDLALERARLLFSTGRLHDALRALDLVHRTDPRRSDADRLRSDIQRELIAHDPLAAESVSGAASDDPVVAATTDAR